MLLVFNIMKKEISNTSSLQGNSRARLSYWELWGNITRISDFEYEGKHIQITECVSKFQNLRCSEKHQKFDSKSYVEQLTQTLRNGDWRCSTVEGINLGETWPPGARELWGQQMWKGQGHKMNMEPLNLNYIQKNLGSSFLLSPILLVSYLPKVNWWTHECRDHWQNPNTFFPGL